jgi:predicted PurR-regulated permease PerM
LIFVAGALFGLLGVFVVLPVVAILRDTFAYAYRRLGEQPIEVASTVLSGIRSAGAGTVAVP